MGTMTRGEIESAFYAEMGRKLRAKRKERKMSQSALAVEVGVHRNTIYRIEVGEVPLDFWLFLRICDILDSHPMQMAPRVEFTWGDDLRPMAAERDPKRRIRFERDPPGPDLHI